MMSRAGRVPVVLLGLVLLLAQLQLAVHASQHPFHHTDSSCYHYVVADHSDSALPAMPQLPPVMQTVESPLALLLPLLARQPSFAYLSRAPPPN